tara:strand:+ start:42 stop:335 length:294 start_codon:yes stop_codon:yes gene_type:complete
MDNRPVNYDPNESTWKFGKLVSKFPDTLLSESLVFSERKHAGTSQIESKKKNDNQIKVLENEVSKLKESLQYFKSQNYLLRQYIQVVVNHSLESSDK